MVICIRNNNMKMIEQRTMSNSGVVSYRRDQRQDWESVAADDQSGLEESIK
ncbi:MAG: hypothetical protein P0116_08445 [Candidatus Nitrosocosmicus sp.]|nr:hypothetical protein [Candidatus Nitrosocosmicus sp.]